MLSERTLRKWRVDALMPLKFSPDVSGDRATLVSYITYANERILRLTQELLDQHLLRKEQK